MKSFAASAASRFLFVAVALAILAPARAFAQPPAPRHEDITYIVPQFLNYRWADDAAFARQVEALRTRIGEGPYVKVGFSVYIWMSFDDWNVDVNDPAAIRAAMAPTIADIDAVIDRARAHHVPICLAILNSIRGFYDPVQLAAEGADRRNMEWYSDNTLAHGWMTYSRYARHFRAVEEAYLRELGKVLANRMARYPETLIAAAGDGEEELSNRKTPVDDPDHYGLDNMKLADFSPFAVAEFRDWLRRGGLYAAGEPFEGQAYDLAGRYDGDASPGLDSNGDGHTLNGDFGTAFTTWRLRVFDWALDDEPGSAVTKSDGSYRNPLTETEPAGFDPPRQWDRADPWWQLWHLFRQTMLWRHNVEFAKWVTTSVDPDTGATVPPARWFSYQIPADYAFGGTPDNPNLRFDTSASAWWTGDVAPFGGIGLTTFNGYIDIDLFARTLINVAPHVAERNQRFALLEWHPSIPVAPPDSPIWDDEMAIIERYRPAVIGPFALDDRPRDAIFDTGFEISLKKLVDRIKDGDPSDARLAVDTPRASTMVRQPFLVAGWALDLGTIRGPGRGAGVDRVEVYATRAGSSSPVLLGLATYGGARADVGAAFGAPFAAAGFNFLVRGLAPGAYDLEVRAHSRGVSTAAVTSHHVAVTVQPNSLITIDTPRSLDRVRQPFLVAGWALDNASQDGSGVDAVDTFAYPEAGPPIYLGRAEMELARPDVGGTFGAPFATAGFRLAVKGLSPGRYRIVAYAHSRLSGAFDAVQTVDVTVESSTLLWVDAPIDGSVVSGSFVVSGWGLDLASVGGPGVDAIHAWATPADGSAPLFLGAAFPGVARPDVAAAFGAQFIDAGFAVAVTDPLPPGDYLLSVYAHNALTQTFEALRVVRVTVW